MKLINLQTALAAILPIAFLFVSPIAAQECQCPLQAAKMAAKKHQMELMTVSTAAQEMDIVDTAVKAGAFKTLVAAVTAADLGEALKSKGPFTVFAPTDEAFAKLPKGTVETLLKPENKKQLIAILKYHVVKGKVMAGDVVKLTSAPSLQGSKINIKVVDGKVMLNEKTQVVKTDIGTSNGVIHVIDSVIMPPADIVDTAVSAKKFNTLVAAVKAAGLVETLKSEGPFTVFAPTDDAFAKIDGATLKSLLLPENKEKLTAILTYHVVPGRVAAADVVKLNSAKTVNGSEVSIKVENGTVMVDNAKVVATDIDCGNGIIHIIDSVIMPK
ncbi:MAG: fasciclin domain-containing protein [Planctomycetota bacterium]